MISRGSLLEHSPTSFQFFHQPLEVLGRIHRNPAVMRVMLGRRISQGLDEL
jgi:hypothetical protein